MGTIPRTASPAWCDEISAFGAFSLSCALTTLDVVNKLISIEKNKPNRHITTFQFNIQVRRGQLEFE
jgi:hypothetical protein